MVGMLFNSHSTEEVFHDSENSGARINAVKSTALAGVNKSNETCSDGIQAILQGPL